MELTLSPMMTEVRAEQQMKALFFMQVTLSGKVTEVRARHSLKAGDLADVSDAVAYGDGSESAALVERHSPM